MISTRHWMIAGGLAISLHAGAFYAVFYNPTEGSEALGSQGIEFDLGVLGDLGMATQTTAAQEEAKEIEEVVEEPIKKTQQEVEPEVVEEAEVVEESVIEPESEVVEEPVIAPEVIQEPEPVEVKQESPIEVKKPKPKSKPEKKPKPKPEKKPEPEPEPKKQAQAIVKAAPKQVTPPAITSQKATTGSANSASSGGNPGAKASYVTQLTAVLAQNKRYPRASRHRNEEGMVALSFVVHADGSVSDVKIIQSSGHKRLDSAVLDMIKQSMPLPKFPKDMTESELAINLPISFKLS